MSSFAKKPLKSFLTYPFTWAALGVVIVLHIAFTIILQPTLFMTLGAVALDLAAMILWFVLAFKSESFKKHFNRMPYEDKGRQLEAVINACPEKFRRSALESIELIKKINQEFSDSAYSYELELMLLNIQDVSQNHKILSERALHFGNPQQKKRMETIMASQFDAINNTLATLKTFGGNLTLLAADTQPSKAATDELKFINQGLKEVIEEL